MFASKLRSLRTASNFLQHGYGMSKLVRSRRLVANTFALAPNATSLCSPQPVRCHSDRSVRQDTTVRDAISAIDGLFTAVVSTHTFQPSDLTSQVPLIQRHLNDIYSVKMLAAILRACARVTMVTEEDSAVTNLVVAVLDHAASLPTDLWQDSKNQGELRWMLCWASRCRCTTSEFRQLLQNQLDVESIGQCREVDRCAHALFSLNIADPTLAMDLMSRYSAIQSTGDPKYRHTEVFSLLLYCTLCGVECSALLELISVDQLIQKCGAHHLQRLILLDTLLVTNKQRREIMNRCSESFRKEGRSPNTGRMYDMLSCFIGPEHTTGVSLVDGVAVQALCIVNRDSKPVETSKYPADVFNGVSVDMTAAKRHGFSVVACLGVGDTRLLRHPAMSSNGYSTLLASALKSQGCFIIPVILEHGAARTQNSGKVVNDLMINYPGHIKVFRDLLAPNQSMH
ncbi:uncharacterized protein LOC135823990 isoform X1 [Sycon ciliatum]|uniref:uncharacterized protein LOC135823990 isoform X1 n=1 Tax=Sycon ciliatum TaxID=27933 RepID=UPI0031F70FEA